MSPLHGITAWAVTSGEDGMRTQARGLALAVAEVVVEKTAAASPLAFGSRPARRADRFVPPWPDVLISCGRRSVRTAMAVRRLSGNKTLTVHIQDPLARLDAFNLIVAMTHDRIPAGGNVIKVATALHDLTAENLAAAGAQWRERLGRLGRPLAGVTIGGDTKRQAFASADGQRLIGALERLRAGGVSLAITPSRRTPATLRKQLEQAFGGDPNVFLWDMGGDNPYRGMLALCDRLIVTGDSVSMISEALSTSHPVEVFDLGFERYRSFLGDLLIRGLVRRFEGDPRSPVMAGPVNATLEAADAVRRLIQARTGVSG